MRWFTIFSSKNRGDRIWVKSKLKNGSFVLLIRIFTKDISHPKSAIYIIEYIAIIGILCRFWICNQIQIRIDGCLKKLISFTVEKKSLLINCDQYVILLH